MKKIFLFCVIFHICLCVCFAQVNSNVLDFNISGIKIGDSYKKFYEKFPNARLLTSNDYTKCYGVKDATKNIDLVGFTFFNNKVYAIECLYESATVKKLGGWEAIRENFFYKYGNLTFQNYNFDGNFFDARDLYMNSIVVQFQVKKEGALFINFADTTILEEINNAKKADKYYGF